MCHNANEQIANVMMAIQPTLVNVLTILNVAQTEQGKAAIAAFATAESEVAQWKPGTSAQTVIQAIDAFTSVYDAVVQSVPVPVVVTAMVNTVSAGIVLVIGVLSANQGAAASIDSAEAKAQVDETTKKIKALVPIYHESKFDRVRAALGDTHVAAREYKQAWNHSAQAAGYSQYMV